MSTDKQIKGKMKKYFTKGNITAVLICILFALQVYIMTILEDNPEEVEPASGVESGQEEQPFSTNQIGEPNELEATPEPEVEVGVDSTEGDSEDTISEVGETKEPASSQFTPVPSKPLSKLNNYFIAHEEDMNGLAVGFGMMSTVLDDYHKIKDVIQIKNEMLFTEGQYRDIFDRLKADTTHDASLVQKYEELFELRMAQAEGLEITPEGKVSLGVPQEDLEKSKVLWSELVKVHKQMGTDTGVDFTGGLGNLLK